MNYQGKDGLRRNIGKLRDERYKVAAALKRTFREDMKTQPHRVVHNYVDLWVEAQRASPYYMGHLDAFLYPVLIILAAVGWL